MKHLLLFIFVIFTSNSFSQTNAQDFLQRGLETHEGLFAFLATHPCEIGLDRSCERPLKGEDIDQLKKHLRDLEEWRKIAFDGFVPMTRLMVDLPSEVSLGSSFSITKSSRINPGTHRSEDYLKIVLSPGDEETHHFTEKAREGTATVLLLYDSFFRLSQIIGKARKLRSILQHDMPEEGPFLNKTYALALNEELWQKTTFSLKFLEAQRALLPRGEAPNFFDQYLQKSFVAERMLEDDLDYRIRNILFLQGQINESRFFETVNFFVGFLSRVFGNTAGMFQTRDGKLKALASDRTAMKQMKSMLRPLDILLEKTPFRLTDQFIPGYFGHVAIWLGSYEELEEMQVNHNGKKIPFLTHPDVLPHLESLSKEKFVVEALRIPGVKLNTLEHFLDVDDFVVLAAPEMGEEEKAQMLIKAFQQIGKPYDFNFDIETEREIVCSELAYTVYGNMSWPTSQSVGRNTISPDQIAWKAVDSCFEPSIMYLKGESITKDFKQELRKVLESPGGINYTPTSGCFKKLN